MDTLWQGQLEKLILSCGAEIQDTTFNSGPLEEEDNGVVKCLRGHIDTVFASRLHPFAAMLEKFANRCKRVCELVRSAGVIRKRNADSFEGVAATTTGESQRDGDTDDQNSKLYDGVRDEALASSIEHVKSIILDFVTRMSGVMQAHWAVLRKQEELEQELEKIILEDIFRLVYTDVFNLYQLKFHTSDKQFSENCRALSQMLPADFGCQMFEDLGLGGTVEGGGDAQNQSLALDSSTDENVNKKTDPRSRYNLFASGKHHLLAEQISLDS